MAELRIWTARHTIRVAAAPRRVYQLIANVHRWPQLFDATVTVEHLGFEGSTERVHLWELFDREVRGCVTHRDRNPQRMQVRFRQVDPQPPVASMGGLWMVVPKGSGAQVVLDHHYRVTGDDPAEARWLAGVVDRNGRAMLAALKQTAELDGALSDLWLSTEDSVDIGGEARDVYDFLARAQDWPQRLPHVDRLLLDEDVPDIQHLETATRLPNGTVHTTNTVRVCFPETHIVYEQVTPPTVMRALTGRYTVARLGTGVRATVRHTVLLRPDAVAGLVAQGSTVDDVRASVLDVLHDLSRVTLGRAKEFAEARRPVWATAIGQDF